MAEDINFGLDTDQDQFKRLKRKLKEADRNLRTGFNKKVREALAPLKRDIKESAELKLPKKGGLARKVARSRYTVSSKSISLSFRTTNPLEIGPINAGMVRHPVFGRDVWVDQKVTPGFWSDPVDHSKDEIVAAVKEVVEDTARELET